MIQARPVLLLTSPSTDRCSDNNLVEIAERVVEEFRAEQGEAGSEFSDGDDTFSGMESDETLVSGEASEDGVGVEEEEEEKSSDVEEDFEFEFAFAPRETAFSPISADEVFCNGQIRPIFPVHKRNLLIGEEEFLNGNCNSVAVSNYGVDQRISSTPQPVKPRLPLRKLFTEERETLSSCSSSEADELDGVPAETYCVWRPKPADDQLSPGRCKKSNSTGSGSGSSKRWKFRDLLYRSNSDGKDAFVFLTSTFKNRVDKIAAGKSKPN
ncbi:uncharacterized protein LOC116010679 [Ipomoea triloba]|uniref:uncharacterized protein LOC116010679 n=1 Tax=Ipomoea triloba TaxID=35885 RepID=UPI00125E8058|nr:uncharacterized protein LOC116010679 [Ipomoea triloba]